MPHGRRWEIRHNANYPFRNRWLIVRARERFTWRELWDDLIYLMRG